MATRTPGLQTRSQFHRYWGAFADGVSGLPNQAGNPLVAAQFTLEAGDAAFNTGTVAGAPGEYVCFDPGTAGGGDAVWSLVGPGAGTTVATRLESSPGAFTAPAGSAPGDLVYIVGADVVALADQALGIAAMGIITAKPLATTATVAYAGEVPVAIVLTPGTRYFLGTLGQLTAIPPDSAALAGTGTISQFVGVAKNAGTLILEPDPGVIL